ncbi:hypothetical protein [Acinetobacter sp. DSM 11652]|jgi:lysyl-tRNA synthetase class I|uniref:hypothetical protein n=1 Tax=Acinetobacter sp. DSM 11652 TaxID=346222 RepID=UPI0008C5885F|nr:hypothetical protein [Acinetobacter sp. DSM 11652]SEM09253.1 hypothetical protein SAMN05216500_11111 [Acinetobacter sp. DSM 11652]
MKKLLIASLCTTAVFLTACDKKSNDQSSPTAAETVQSNTLSTNVNADIQHDLDLLDQISNTKAQEALAFQNEVTQAAQNNNKAELDAVVEKMDNYVDQFNDDLDKLALKSTEGASLRDKMKESNELGLDLAEAGVKEKPDMNEITELQKKAVELQQSLLQDMQNLKNQVGTKS